MCGLCGFLNYGKEKIDLHELTNALTESAAERGTDACGIAYCNGNNIVIQKTGKSAYMTNFKPPKYTKALIGHTRHSTQGSEKNNYNNHPFYGKVGNTKFALAHNGVLINDTELRTKKQLPQTKIETDSYIAVQLLEMQDKLNHDTMRHMAESVRGSFSFSILDNNNNLHLIKGDSPLCIIHMKKKKLYVYASTEMILWKALIETELFTELKAGNYEEMPLRCGEIMTITNDGRIQRGGFDYTDYSVFDWRSYGNYTYSDYGYLTDLRSAASALGYTEEDIELLQDEGFSYDEIEDILYAGYEGVFR